ncbi:MAG: SPFH domain-containing protein [Bacillota bacterium]
MVDLAQLGSLILLSVAGLFVLLIAASSIRLIQQSQVGIVERLGRFHKKAERGLNILVPFIDRMRALIELREQVIDYPPQPVITKDNVTMSIDTVIYFQVTDAVKYTYEIANPRSAIEYLTATTLRNIIGDLDLDETLTSRDMINTRLRVILDEATDKWGIKVNRVELKNINPPRDIQDAMEKQMRAERERREAILRAEGEKRSSILRAEGEREAAIARAEGQKQAAILAAQGEAEAILAVQRAKAEGLKAVYGAIKEIDPTQQVVSLRALEALERVADGQATKLIVPTDAMSVLGALASVKEILGGEKPATRPAASADPSTE